MQRKLCAVVVLALSAISSPVWGESRVEDTCYAAQIERIEPARIAHKALRLRVPVRSQGAVVPSACETASAWGGRVVCALRAASLRADDSDTAMPEIWRRARSAARDHLPQRTTDEVRLVVSVMLVHGPSHTVPGVGLSGEF